MDYSDQGWLKTESCTTFNVFPYEKESPCVVGLDDSIERSFTIPGGFPAIESFYGWCHGGTPARQAHCRSNRFDHKRRQNRAGKRLWIFRRQGQASC